MVNISTQNPQSKYSVRNKWIDGFTLAAIISNGGGGALAGSMTDLTQLQLKATLRRNGAETVLFNTTAKNILIMSLILNPLYYFIYSPGTAITLLANAKVIQPFRFDFGGPLNLTGNDELTIEWQLNSTFFSATNASVASCYVQLDECECSDIEWITPVLSTIVIEGSQQNPSYSLGDNVLSIILANYDKTDLLDASIVCNNIKLSSSSVNKNDNFYELVTKQYSYYANILEPAYRYQNFILYSGGNELDGVSLDLNLNTSNVTSSKNFVLTRSFVTSDWLVTRATELSKLQAAASENKGSYDESLILGGKSSRN